MGHGDHLHGSAALKIPLIFRPAGGNAGRHVDNAVSNLDIAPTLLELANVPPLPGAQGRSLVSLIEGNAHDARYKPENICMVLTPRLRSQLESRGLVVRKRGKDGTVSEIKHSSLMQKVSIHDYIIMHYHFC